MMRSIWMLLFCLVVLCLPLAAGCSNTVDQESAREQSEAALELEMAEQGGVETDETEEDHSGDE
jgi:hypothetical protein